MDHEGKDAMKKKQQGETHLYQASLFGWFQGHEGMGDTSLSRLGLSTRGRVPVSFQVTFPSGVKTFTHQYHVTSNSDDYESKYMAVYWCGDQIIHVHCC